MALVSVIVPNYNHEKFLVQRMESILSQTFQDFEVIILDDCSTDGSRDVIERYRNHPKVRHIVFNNENSGSPFKQWLKGLNLADGVYVWIAESYDVASNNFLLTALDTFKKDEDLRLVFASSQSIDQKGTFRKHMDDWLAPVSETHWKSDYINHGRDEISNYLAIRNTIPNASAVVIKKEVISRYISLLQGLKYLGDWYLWLTILKDPNAKIGYVSTDLNYFRFHPQSTRQSPTMPEYIGEWCMCLLYAKRASSIEELNPISYRDIVALYLRVPFRYLFGLHALRTFFMCIKLNWRIPFAAYFMVVKKYIFKGFNNSPA